MLSETQIPYPKNPNDVLNKNIKGFLKGIPSSSGIAIGSALIIEPEPPISGNNYIDDDKIESEVVRFNESIESLNDEFNEVLENADHLGASVQTIIETYKLFINDSFINSNIRTRINEGMDSESAIITEYEAQKSLFKNAKDQILRERATDLDNVKMRLLSTFRQHSPDYSLGNGKILVAQTLSPTDIVKYKEAGVVGIITEMGGIASHVSILARSFEIPAVIGVKDATKIITDGLGLIIDGFTGLIIYNPDYSISKRYNQRIRDIELHKQSLGKLVQVVSQTKDKKRIHLLANVDRLEDVKSALLSGAEGIGLVRSETLLSGTSGKIPNEDIQYGWYREIVDRMYPETVTIRCFDVGNDKFSTGIPLHENNPALGLRGIRFLLYSKDILKTQLKAILRASVNKNVRVMIPMVSDLSELLTVKEIISSCMLELDKSSIPYDLKLPVGIMIETPSAVLTSDILAKECDFFSIGTNDLTQYTLAADRTNDLVTDIYDSFHPAVLKMIAITAKNASEAGIQVGLCGELAGHSAATPLLIGMGINELSVPPSLLLELKNRILKINYSEAKTLATELLKMSNSNDILQVLDNEATLV